VGYPTICREWQADDHAHPPERRLCVAMMRTAIEDILGQSAYETRKEEQREQNQAYWWLFKDRYGIAHISAHFCCQTMDFPLSTIRAWLHTHHAVLMEQLDRDQ